MASKLLHVATAMDDRELNRLFQRIVLSVASLPLALGTAACGGSTEGGEDLGSAGQTQGTGGSVASGGSSASGGFGAGGSAGSGSGGIASGGFGAVAGSVSTGGAGGAGGMGGTAGNAGAGGSAGDPSCAGPPKDCFTSTSVVLPIDCVGDPTQPPTADQCAAFCPVQYGTGAGSCTVSGYDDASVTVLCYATCFVGRRPSDFENPTANCSSLGTHFAEIARLEAASVDAFRHLRRELATHGAPRALLRRVSAAARDEVRHARRTAGLARRFGGAPLPAFVRRPAPRPLAALALENVIEGCVRETFGALVAHHQATHARDPELRAALRRIARDETRHAALSWAIQHWLEPRLDRAQRERVRAAKIEAARALHRELAQPAPRDDERLAGLATPGEAQNLLSALARELWAA